MTVTTNRWVATLLAIAAVAVVSASAPATAAAQTMPVLTEPVTDTAGVIDPASAAAMDRLSRALLAASGDVVVVVTVPTIAPFADAREYAVKLFANGGRGIGAKDKKNGLLMLLAVKERQVRVEVGYDLEAIITDGFAGETSRETMVPFFRQNEYGQGLLAGMQRIVGRISEARGVTLQEMPAAPARRPASRSSSPPSFLILLAIYFAFVIVRWTVSSVFGWPRRRWGGGGWSGWSGGGVGGFGGGGSSGGFGGGFGGFGGGSSGGGGGGASW